MTWILVKSCDHWQTLHASISATQQCGMPACRSCISCGMCLILRAEKLQILDVALSKLFSQLSRLQLPWLCELSFRASTRQH